MELKISNVPLFVNNKVSDVELVVLDPHIVLLEVVFPFPEEHV